MQASTRIADLLAIMARLRDPENGCAWDLKQDFASIAPYTIEEAYEVADVAERGAVEDLCDELGDLLLQVVFHAQMAREKNAFAFEDVVQSITAKLIRRHPHIFGDKKAYTAEEVKTLWEQVKAEEKKGRPNHFLHDVPLALPSLQRAVKLQEKASTVGFDWNDPKAVLAKLREEIDEIEAELDAGAHPDRLQDELGDLMFAAVNLARHLKADPDQALRRGNQKFARRFAAIEAALAAQGRTPA